MINMRRDNGMQTVSITQLESVNKGFRMEYIDLLTSHAYEGEISIKKKENAV